MKNNIPKKEISKGVNPVLAAMTGAVIGAGVAVAGTVVMKDKNNQEKVKKVLTDVKDKAVAYIGKIEKEVKKDKNEILSKVEGKITNAQKNIKKTAKDVKKDITKGVKNI